MSRATFWSGRQGLLAESSYDLVVLGPALMAALIGLFILFGVGFAEPEAIHAAAHDVRHGFSFPCH